MASLMEAPARLCGVGPVTASPLEAAVPFLEFSHTLSGCRIRSMPVHSPGTDIPHHAASPQLTM